MVIHFFDVSMTHLSPSIMKSFLVNFINIDQKMILCAHKKMLFESLDESKRKFEEIFEELNFKNYKFLYSDKDFFENVIIEAKRGNLCVLHGYLYLCNTMSKILKIYWNFGILKKIIRVDWSVDTIKCLTFKSKIKHLLISNIYSAFKYNIVLIDTEKEFLRNIYNKKLKNIVVAPYFGIEEGLKKIYKIKEKIKTVNKVRILVSHSGHVHNGHIEVLYMLKEKFDLNIGEISMPLCYGPQDYIEKVIECGKLLFGDRFNYFTELKPRLVYIEYIRSYDVFVTAAPIQTGLFAMQTALGNGLKVFCKGLLLGKFVSEGCVVFDLDKLFSLGGEDLLIQPLSESEIKINYDKMSDVESFRKIVKLWHSILIEN